MPLITKISSRVFAFLLIAFYAHADFVESRNLKQFHCDSF
jgi:hypothetical protein